MQRRPRVTFVVPCYKLAHLLPECLDSILGQTFGDLEILVMDDHSPDDTPAVVASYSDPRVTHVRNHPNLGHLRNYNKGIAMARGDYIWLISADDRLRSPHVLDRYVREMDANPNVGYAFCRGLGLLDGRETEIVGWADLQRGDGILNGREFLRRLLQSNCVLAPAGLVRRECYDKLGMFPLDLPFAGDWYLWCIFSLHFDAAYFSEPMVNYREHPASMTDQLIERDIRRLAEDDLAVRWRMWDHIAAFRDEDLLRHCVDTIVDCYAGALASRKRRGARYRMRLAEFEASLATHCKGRMNADDLRVRVLSAVGGQLFFDPELTAEPELYRLALRYRPWDAKLWLRYAVSQLGAPGHWAMMGISALRGNMCSARKKAR
jgi:glycosyltransferase involved in cell wall biosynthesis